MSDKRFSHGVCSIARLYQVDIDRIDAAVKLCTTEGALDHLDACRRVKENIVGHGYPEPRRAPKGERCCNCRAVKGECGPECGVFSSKPQPPPDVPRWMGPADVERPVLAKQDEDEQCPSCRVRKENNVGPCGPCSRAKPEPEPTWDNPGPCSCGSNSLRVDEPSAEIGCNGCGRRVHAEYADWKKDKPLFRHIALQAWIEGKGEAGKLYYAYVDSEPEKPSWDNPGPCSCGSTMVYSLGLRASLRCSVCGRDVRCTFHDPPVGGIDKAAARAIVLKAWTEGKGAARKIHYVEKEPR